MLEVDRTEAAVRHANALHKFIKHHFFTFYDPVTRVPPLWGSGGKTDMVSQWTYVYPDPIKIGQAADEVIAMAQGTPGQKTACMTQAIWYRNQTAPQNLKVANPPDWMGYEPDAKFVTIAPDALREAFWSKVSRRIDAIMYHGTGSLIERSATHQYRYTNPESKGVLRDLANTVVKPLGPVLTKVPERAPEVAILESFTGSIYGARHFPMGWSNKWVADLHLALQWAHFQPVILYDQHILTDYYKTLPKVLFLPGLEVVTESMLNKLRQYQKQGVILIGDEFTAPAIMPDYRTRSVARTVGDPAGSKKALQKLGREIAAMLKDHYRSPMAADSQELVIRRRGSDAADYVFVLNDHRTFGDYLGQWGLVMEKGLPQSGTVTVGHGAVKGYDLVKHTEIPLRHDAGGVSFDVALGPGDGMLVLLLDRAIDAVAVSLPELRRGEPYSVTVKILDKDGRPVPAILPVEVTLTASDGATLPGSGFYAARNGELTIPEVAAPNMAPGKVRVAARCLASGLAAVRETVAR